MYVKTAQNREVSGDKKTFLLILPDSQAKMPLMFVVMVLWAKIHELPEAQRVPGEFICR